jgi:hypothetical protein
MPGAGAITAPRRARRTRKNRWQKSILPAASDTVGAIDALSMSASPARGGVGIGRRNGFADLGGALYSALLRGRIVVKIG